MKRAVLSSLTFSVLFVGLPANASPPEIVRLSGVISELSGGPVENGSYSFLVEIFDEAVGGQLLYSQTITASVAGGAYSIVLSPATPGDLAAALSDSPRFVQVTVQSGPTGAIGQLLLPRQELASVPFSLNIGLPQGAIILWDSQSGCDGAATTCPCGFEEATEFRGLTVRGADTALGNPDLPDQPGTNMDTGQADDVLDETELPGHSHLGWGAKNAGNGIWPDGIDSSGGNNYTGAKGNDGDNVRFNSSTTGGDQPHYHPFRTVLFCRRN